MRSLFVFLSFLRDCFPSSPLSVPLLHVPVSTVAVYVPPAVTTINTAVCPKSVCVFFLCSLFQNSVTLSHYITSHDRIMREWWTGKDSEGSGRGLVGHLTGICLEGLTGSTKRPSVSDCAAEIRTKALLNTVWSLTTTAKQMIIISFSNNKRPVFVMEMQYVYCEVEIELSVG
jgi:hypothetical protein